MTTVILNGKRYEHKYIRHSKHLSEKGEKLDGFVDYEKNKSGKKRIRVQMDLNPEEKLETNIHEALHAIFPFLNEDAVLPAAKELQKMLTTLGYVNKEDVECG